jgi:oxygen-dependent protoporphyrinogen oxidase
MSHHDADVIVVGAGLTGLTAAFRLTLQGFSVEVLDAALHAGGVIGTRRHEVDGGTALYELGPNSGMDTTPLINALLRDLGILDQRLDAQPAAARRYILRNGRIRPVPTSPLGFITTPLFSWQAKIGLLREPFIRPPAEPQAEQSIAAFVRRHLGQEMLDYAVEPFVGGVYAGDPEMLSVDAAFPRLAELDRRYGSLMRGAILSARERKHAETATGERAKTRATSFNFKGGMQTLIDAFVRHLPRLVCAARVQAVRREGDGLFAVEVERRGERLTRRAPALVLALPAFEAAPLVTGLGAAGESAANALTAIHYPPVATTSVIYRRKDVSHPLDGFGFLAPRIENPPVLGTLFASSMFAERAPAGTVVLTSFLGGRRNPQAALAPDEHIAADVVRCNAHLLGAEPPLFTAVRRWPRAIPQYDLGHLKRLAQVDALEAQVPGLVLCGNWRDGVSVADCIKAGHRRAEEIAARLTTRNTSTSSVPQDRALSAA